MLDQRLLPGEEVSYTYTTYQGRSPDSIREMVIRGRARHRLSPPPWASPSACKNPPLNLSAELRAEFPVILDTLAKTRPTAVDLFWALDRMKHRFEEVSARTQDLSQIIAAT